MRCLNDNIFEHQNFCVQSSTVCTAGVHKTLDVHIFRVETFILICCYTLISPHDQALLFTINICPATFKRHICLFCCCCCPFRHRFSCSSFSILDHKSPGLTMIDSKKKLRKKNTHTHAHTMGWKKKQKCHRKEELFILQCALNTDGSIKSSEEKFVEVMKKRMK